MKEPSFEIELNSEIPFPKRVFVCLLAGFAVHLLVGSFTGIGNFFIVVNNIPTLDFQKVYLDHIGKWLPWMFMVPVVFELAVRQPFSSSSWKKPLALHLLASMLWGPIHLFLIITFEMVRHGLPPNMLFIEFRKYFGLGVLFTYHWYWFLFAAVQVMILFHVSKCRQQHAHELELQKVNLQKSLANQKVQTLRAQLKPDFLFNSQNAIAGLIREQKLSAALALLNQLSTLLRFSLEADDTNSLAKEMDFIETYLKVQETRFPGTLIYSLDTGDASEFRVPSFLFMPLIEGVVEASRGWPMGNRLQIMSQMGDQYLLVSIQFDCQNDQGLQVLQTGLHNIHKRLCLVFGERAHFECELLEWRRLLIKFTIPARNFND